MNDLIETLERRGLITTKPEDAAECCGLERDEDGFCVYRPHHPVYVVPDRSDTAPLEEEGIALHTMRHFFTHNDKRICGFHSRLGVWVTTPLLDGQSVRCLRDHLNNDTQARDRLTASHGPGTLGDMADVFRDWKESGVTRSSMLYVVDRVWWEDDEVPDFQGGDAADASRYLSELVEGPAGD